VKHGVIRFILGHGSKLTKKLLVKGAIPSQNLPARDSDSIVKHPEKIKRVARSIVQDQPLVSDERKFQYKNLKELSARVKKLTLNDWKLTVTKNQVRLCKFEVPYITPRLDIQIDDSLGFTLIVFGWFLCENQKRGALETSQFQISLKKLRK
jgi:hypothetical protein